MRICLLYTLFFFLALLWCTDSTSQNYITKISTHSVKAGLSRLMLTDLFEDSRGFVWITNREGIHRFDGRNFKAFLFDYRGVHSSHCTRLAEDVDGNIWTYFLNKKGGDSDHFGQYHFLIDKYFKIHTIDDFFKGKMPFKSSEIDFVYQAADFQLYITTKSGQTFKYDGQFRALLSSSEFFNARITQVNERGDFYLLTANTIFTIDSSGIILNREETPNSSLTYPYLSGTDLDWGFPYLMEGAFKGVDLKEDSKLVRKLFKNSDALNELVTKVSLRFRRIELSGEVLFLASANNYMALYDKTGVLLYDFSATMLKKFGEFYTGFIYLIRKNQIWFNFLDGICIVDFKPNNFEHCIKNNTVFKSNRGLLQLSNGNLLIVVTGGVDEVNLETGLSHQLPFNPPILFWEVIESEERTLFFGGYGPEIVSYQPHTHTKKIIPFVERDQNQVSRASCFVPFEDTHQTIWIGTSLGLAVYNVDLDSLELFQQYNEFEDLKRENVHYFQEEKEGIWLGTSNGLYVLDVNRGITSFYEPLHDLDIYHFYREGDVFWLTTYGNGLVKWNKETGETKRFGKANGMLNESLTGIYPDTMGNLWIASEMGLIRFHKETEEIQVFLESDGIIHNEFNRASHFQAEDGRIYFGGLQGVNAFYPKDIQERSIKNMPFLITDYYELNQNTGIFTDKTSDFLTQKSIQLSPTVESFKIHFSLLNYENMEETRYAYKIEGIDKSWILQKENSIRVHQLPYGNYTLKIKAQDYSGHWNKSELAIPIQVIAPFYARWIWQFFGFALLCFLVYSIVKWRLRFLKKQQAHLEQIVQERTKTIENQKQNLTALNQSLKQTNQTKDRLFAILAHDLRNPVLAFQDLAQSFNYLLETNQPERIRFWGNSLEKEAQQLYQLLDNLLNWALAQRNELPISATSLSLSKMVAEIIESNQNLSNLKEVLLQNEVPAGLKIIADRRILDTVFRNIIFNAFRYTKKGSWIKISAQRAEEYIEIKIADNGSGMRKKTLQNLFQIQKGEEKKGGHVSFGLHLCRELLELMNGRISASSELGKGTVFTISIPTDNKM